MSEISIFDWLPTRQNCILIELTLPTETDQSAAPSTQLLVPELVLDCLVEDVSRLNPNVRFECHHLVKPAFKRCADIVVFSQRAALVTSALLERAPVLQFLYLNLARPYAALQVCDRDERGMEALVRQFLAIPQQQEDAQESI